MCPRGSPQGFPTLGTGGDTGQPRWGAFRIWLPGLRAQQAIPHIARVHGTHGWSQLVTDGALQTGAPRARVPEIPAQKRRARPLSSAPPPRSRLPGGPGLPPQRRRAPTRGEATCPPGARRPEPREKEERRRERQSPESHFRPAGGTAAARARRPRKGASRPAPAPARTSKVASARRPTQNRRLLQRRRAYSQLPALPLPPDPHCSCPAH